MTKSFTASVFLLDIINSFYNTLVNYEFNHMEADGLRHHLSERLFKSYSPFAMIVMFQFNSARYGRVNKRIFANIKLKVIKK